jgi:hypothetical protein
VSSQDGVLSENTWDVIGAPASSAALDTHFFVGYEGSSATRDVFNSYRLRPGPYWSVYTPPYMFSN